MGKTPKKTAPGGDERNLYVRRLKATTATTKTSDTSLPESQREQENLNRPKTAGARKLIVASAGKQFKSKLRSPVKSGLNNPGKRITRPVSASSKEERRVASSSILSSKNLKASASSKMQPESEEAEVQLKTSIQKEEEEDEAKNEKTEKEMDQQKNQDSSGKESKDEETESKAEEISEEPAAKSTEVEAEKKESEGQNGNEKTSQEEKEIEETEGCDIKLSFDNEENHKEEEEEQEGQKEDRDVVKVSEEKVTEQNSNPEEEQQQQSEEITNGKPESDVNESQTDTESCSVDVVESTTSELSETNESISQTESSSKDKGKGEDSTTEHEPSFVSYDSSILLKDVKIKLNDCLKDNSTCNIENKSFMDQSLKEMSFGKTLRNISARHSLSRMRNVTLRENRLSPNSSLFVNTSNASINPDDLTDYKVLRYRSHFNDTLSSCNGTPFDRKRKLEPEACSTVKKAKTESKIGLFDSPAFGLLKGSRRPVQVSTPNISTTGYKFSVEKLNIENETNGEPNAGKKWCAIM